MRRRKVCIAMGASSSDYQKIQQLGKIDKLAVNIPGVIYQFQAFPDGRMCFPYTSAGLYNVYGFKPEDVAEDASIVFNRIHPDDVERVAESIRVSRETGEIWVCEYRVILPEMGLRWLHGQSRPEKLEDGSTLWHGYIHDITTRIQLSEQLLEEKTRLTNTIEAANVGTWEWNLKTDEIHVNECWASMLGYSLDEVVPFNVEKFRNLLHPGEIDTILVAIDKHLKGETTYYDTEFRLRNKAGGWTWIHSRGKLTRKDGEGAPETMYSTHIDISIRKLAEQEAQKSRDMQDIFFSQSLTGFFFMMLDEPIVWDENADKHALVEYAMDHQRITKVNQAMLDQYRAKEEDLLGATPRMMFGEHIEEGKVVWRKFFEEGKLHVETKEFRMDGSEVIIEGDYICLYDQKGRVTGNFGVQRDVTEIKNYEAQLQLARDQAELASQAKSQFLANMSHEIRTPLNGVIGFTDLLSRTKLDTTQQLYVENANTAGKALLEIINNILDVSKIEAGKLELETQQHDLVEILEQAISMVKFQACEKGLELHFVLDPNTPRYAYVDAIRLKQVLLNLLSNAVKFTPAGEVTLAVNFTPGAVSGEGLYHFSVSDTGIGISKEQKNRLFKAFSQGDASINRRYGGTGLGLLISDLLVKKMGSQIVMKSTPNEGSVFSFELSTQYSPIDRAVPVTPLPVKKALLIEDNETNRRVMTNLFTHWGVDLLTTDDGLKGIAMLENNLDVELIIVDSTLPHMSGIEVVAQIRSRFKRRIPVILMHVLTETPQIEPHCKELDVSLCYPKPVSPTALHGLLLDPQIYSKNDADSDRLADRSAQEDISPALPVSEKLSILIAEDIEMNMLLVTTLVRQILGDVIILQARDGNEALEQFRKSMVDLVLMDVQMPDMDGLIATQIIRELEVERGSRVPIIALTAGALAEERERCLGAGMDDFLPKPIDMEALKSMIARYVNGEAQESGQG